MATRKGLEPSTSGVTGRRSNQLNYRAKLGGGNNRARTCDPMLVRHVLSQLSYAPGSLPLVGSANPQAAKLIISKTRYFVNSFFKYFFFFPEAAFSGEKEALPLIERRPALPIRLSQIRVQRRRTGRSFQPVPVRG